MLTIDARMIRLAGVGTYLRHLVPRHIQALREIPITLIGAPEELRNFEWIRSASVRVVSCQAPIYSIREQVELAAKIPRDTRLYWSPHYNHALLYRGRLLVTVHDTFHLDMPHFVPGWHRRLYADLMFRAVFARADRVLCVSEFGKAQLLKRFLGHERQIVVVHNGVPRDWKSDPSWESPHPRPYILFVGSVKPHKNLGTLLDAFRLMASRIACDLVIIGRRHGFVAGDDASLQRAAVMERVHFTGEIDHEHEQLRRYYAHAELLAFPSYYESFGLPAAEAMAMGCPVVASDIGGLREVCGEAALYACPDDPSQLATQMERVMTDPALRSRLATGGVERAMRFDWDHSAEQIAGVIKTLM